MPQQRKIKNLEEMRRFAKLLVANDIKATVKIHELDPEIVSQPEYPEVVARIPRAGHTRPWHVRLVDDEMSRADIGGARNRSPFAITVDAGKDTQPVDEHSARTLFEAERVFVQMIVKYRGRKQGRLLPDEDYKAPLPNPSERGSRTRDRMRRLERDLSREYELVLLNESSQNTGYRYSLKVQPTLDRNADLFLIVPRRGKLFVRIERAKRPFGTTTHEFESFEDAEAFFLRELRAQVVGRAKAMRERPEGEYRAPLPDGHARSNPTSKTPKTIYAIAATVIPKQELREVPKEDRGTADGIALSIERSGGPSARGTRTKILRAISEQMLSMSEDRGLRWVGTLDPRISAWSSLVAAKEALRFTDDKRTQRAVEVTERWLTGDATSQEVRNATTKAHDATSDAKTRAAYFASNSAVNAAGAIAKKSAYIVYFAARAAVTAASRDYESERYDEFDEMTEERRAEREEFEAREMNRIFLLIADALPGLPPDPKVYQ